MNRKLLIFVFSFALIILVLRALTYLRSVRLYPPNYTVTFTAQIKSEPQLASGGQKISVTMPNSERVSITFPPDPELSYGDSVRIRGKVQYFEPEPRKKIAYMTKPEFKIISQGSSTSLIYKLRENIISFFDSNMNNLDSSLMLGIVFGIKEQMPQGFYSNLQKTGLLHVIAASGMNITMTAGFFLSIFSLFLRRQAALVGSIIGILLYTLLAGLEPSIVRAAIMGVLVFSAQILGRQSSAWLGLFLAGFVMLFLNPMLIFDVGFQLSFMATLGLIYISPLFYSRRKISLLIEKTFIGGDLVTTIVAQIITLPILVINFGSYSPVSILVNGLVLWTVPILMFFGALAGFAGIVFAPIGHILTYLSLPILSYFESVVNWFGSGTQQLTIDHLPSTILAGYYLLILALVLKVRRVDFHNS